MGAPVMKMTLRGFNMIDLKRDELVERLKNNVCVVEFNKVNGDFRQMTCTLQASVLEENNQVVDYYKKTGKKPNEEVVSVWDLNAKGWRSFRIDKVISFKTETERDQEFERIALSYAMMHH